MPIRILKKYRGKVKVQRSEKVKSKILRMLNAVGYGSSEVKALLQESKELMNICGVIVLRASEVK